MSLLSVKKYHFSNAFEQEDHHHNCVQLLVVQQGLIRVETQASSSIVTEKDGIWIIAGTKHRLTMLKDTYLYSIFVDPLARADFPYKTQVVNISALAHALMPRLIGMQMKYAPHSIEEWTIELFLNELRYLSDLYAFELPYPTDRAYYQICQQISENLDFPWSVADFAKQLNVSERTVARQFHKQTGLTCVEWLRRKRIQTGLELLTQGGNITDVALQVGYDSPSAFSTVFKQRLGFSPRAYIAKLMDKQGKSIK
ncbi:helix-turn-helix domain-containing protein [Commensalibacter oyaizuii]|uniref:AraC family transcriptional regulator n=1 Tax=Commensalibacter oyaizuii TaxID=3043873 RepID=A0ABT6Q134_9PROT|nr:AraC family transcriptional regulator [Commensalibacter sp. TBRC 16381]MDI2090179.1 AraC family transcriptional regulator [Commensalibacter sp. TBRC 16381]